MIYNKIEIQLNKLFLNSRDRSYLVLDSLLITLYLKHIQLQ